MWKIIAGLRIRVQINRIRILTSRKTGSEKWNIQKSTDLYIMLYNVLYVQETLSIIKNYEYNQKRDKIPANTVKGLAIAINK